ncbi:MAG: transposase [Planctomycetaceae bacterium]|nr:transposase [Planctomycetaceae bacterium]
MRAHHRTLKRHQVHRSAVGYLQQSVPLRDYKRKVSASTLWAVLLIAAAEVTSIHAACGRLDGVLCDETVRKALYACLPEFAELHRQLNRALAGRLPRPLRRRAQRLAIDLTLIPYHGEPFRDPAEVYRGLAKDGTSHFHAYATAYVLLRGQRFTVALTAVTKGEPLKGVLQRLLAQARAVGVNPRLVLLDRGFYSVEVIRYLQAARYPFLMPVVIRGRKAGHPQGPSGTRVFALMKRSGWCLHTLSSGTKRTATVSICVSCRNYRGQRKRHGRQVLVYACWGVRGHSCTWVRETYRTRFGIESSYRQMNQARGRTSSRRPELRLLYVGVALVLRNEWVWLHFEVLSSPRRGERLIRLERLRLRTLLHWLTQVIEEAYGTIDETQTERRLCSELLT